MPATRRRSRPGCGCLLAVLPFLLLLALYLFFPGQTNLILMGVDYDENGGMLGRTDTIVLMAVDPLPGTVHLLSIPRDLWVEIPGFGQNRINTAHFFGEASQRGTGPQVLQATIQHNFEVHTSYYVRVRFEGFRQVIDALGGVDITLPTAMAGYEPGQYHLTGRKALAFVRHRYGEDDFFRMQHAQLLLQAALQRALNPLHWWRLPGMLLAMRQALDSNVPAVLWPRLGLALLRAGPQGLDSHTLTRQMATPFTTDQGAQVLLPQWELIRPAVAEIFSR